MNPKVDTYLMNGCGRCPFGSTPQCKVNNWPAELRALRRILLECGLSEELKWAVPCYTYKKNNIAILAAFKEYCGISFFKGALLQDAHNLLHKPGENTQSIRIIRFTDVRQIIKLEALLKAYIFESIEVENSGAKVISKRVSEFSVPEEFQQKLNDFPYLKAAFDALTAGRQRAYLLFFSAPKQSITRINRIEKYIPKILQGKGIQD